MSAEQLKGKPSLDNVETPFSYAGMCERACLKLHRAHFAGRMIQPDSSHCQQRGGAGVIEVSEGSGLVDFWGEMEGCLIWVKKSFQLNSVSCIFLDYIRIYI